MEARHEDALKRIFEADDLWAKRGNQPQQFLLLHEGGMQVRIDHPGWDPSWSTPARQTIDDLESEGLLRVDGQPGNNRAFDLSVPGRERGEELWLESSAPPVDHVNAPTALRLETDAAVSAFLNRVGNDSFDANDMEAGVDVRKFNRMAAVKELRRLEAAGVVERSGRGYKAVLGADGPYFHVRIAPVDARDLLDGPLYALDLSETEVIERFVAPIQEGGPVEYDSRKLLRYRTPKVVRTPLSGVSTVRKIGDRLRDSSLAHSPRQAEESLFNTASLDVTSDYFDPATPTRGGEQSSTVDARKRSSIQEPGRT